MNINKANLLVPGVYYIWFKDCDNKCIASIGMLHDGTSWYAPSNWTGHYPENIASTEWPRVSRVELIEPYVWKGNENDEEPSIFNRFYDWFAN